VSTKKLLLDTAILQDGFFVDLACLRALEEKAALVRSPTIGLVRGKVIQRVLGG
jgi:hypothetical protein